MLLSYKNTIKEHSYRIYVDHKALILALATFTDNRHKVLLTTETKVMENFIYTIMYT